MADGFPDALRRRRGSYFFLSYYSPEKPSFDEPSFDRRRARDPWVSYFFEELCTQVIALRPATSDLDSGAVDLAMPRGARHADWVRAALATSSVFVPLYTTQYLTSTDTLTELDAFQSRVGNLIAAEQGRSRSAAGPVERDGHIIPVLWNIVEQGDFPAEVAAATQLADDILEYAQHGLSVLCRHARYADQYSRIVRRLARQIVAATPLPHSDPIPLVEVAKPGRSAVTPFVVVVLAPTTHGVPGQRQAVTYDGSASGWRPFAEETASAAEQVANVVRRSGDLLTNVVDYTINSKPFAASPGVLLVDPWILETPDGLRLVKSVSRCMKQWASVLVVVNDSDPDYSDHVRLLGDRVTELISGSQLLVFHSAEEFQDALRIVVQQTRRRYLNTGRVYPPPGAMVPKPRIDPDTGATGRLLESDIDAPSAADDDDSSGPDAEDASSTSTDPEDE